MKTDAELKHEVTRELEWDPSIDATQIGVAVNDGVVTLTGHLDSYVAKFSVEKAVGRVRGVKAIAMELDVNLGPGHKRSDADIAAAAELALRWHSQVPRDQIRVRVEKGWVTLSGEVDWEYQRHNAEKSVRTLTGVVGVNNSITLKATVTPANIAGRIREALTRHAEHDAKQIEVEVKGPVATLRGTVDSWPERSAAFGAAWSAPGISSVVNEINVKV